MIKGIIQADLNNDTVKRYLEHSLRSFEPVKDIFEIEVIQCVTPESDLIGPVNMSSFDESKKRSPQEKASLLSQYRLMRRLSEGHSFFIMEHDAYLRPEYEDVFRMVMSKYRQMMVCNIGIAMECYTCHNIVAEIFCYHVEYDSEHKMRGPMGILHASMDSVSRKIDNKWRNVYWPKEGQDNKTGISSNVSRAFRDPEIVLDAPITQLIDESVGSTVTDRPNIKSKYTRKSHPNFHWITLDK